MVGRVNFFQKNPAGLCRKLGLEDAARTKMDKIEYKKEVEKGCRFMDKQI